MKSTKVPRLAKKNKTRLPRRQKKALRNAEAAKGINLGIGPRLKSGQKTFLHRSPASLNAG